MELLPWAHATSAGFTLRGWHSPPSGKPLLHFLHGNGFCTRSYEPLLELLAEDFDLWLCDLQGHGQSDKGDKFVGWNRNAELALEAFDAGREQFEAVPYVACGHSFGGVLTGLMLSARPELFKRAVLLDPVFFPPGLITLRRGLGLLGLRNNPVAKRASARRDNWPDRAAAHAGLYNRGMFRGWHDDAFAAHIAHALRDHPERGVELCCHPSREAEVFMTMPQGLWRALRRIRTPLHIIYGDRTYPFVGASARRLAGSSNLCTAHKTAGGHCFMLEHPQHTAQQVARSLLSETGSVRTGTLA
ncbi:MAG: alpha/beta hydrolase [Halopseudomonas sp.]|uniref:alpha/beta fold hydrolase n=1 Tax=Halopseudomonas sp. TaxID=2901191 RepID=UPI003001AC4C